MWGLQQLSHLRSGPGPVAGGSAIPTVAGRFPPSSFGIKLDNGEMVWLVEAVRHAAPLPPSRTWLNLNAEA